MNSTLQGRSRGVAQFLVSALIVSAITVSCPGAYAATPAARGPAWLVLTVGQTAYIKEDGRISQRATVCEDASAYTAFARGVPAGECHPVDRGTMVRVMGLQGSLDLDGIVTPLVEIAAASGEPLGVVDATLLQPLVPTGTILEALTVGDYPSQLWSKRRDSADNEIADAIWPKETSYLSPHTLVQVVEQAPYDRAADLRIRVLTGPRRGQTGWMVQLFVPHTRLAVDDFDFPTKVNPATMFR
jgi:hypothetical protein